MNSINQLSTIQQNVLIASILGDGEITKLYKNSRRKNNSYREHFSRAQLAYRQWKLKILSPLLYINKHQDTLRSKSMPLFTDIFDDFYDPYGNKVIPSRLLSKCTDISFLATLYMDDGTLSISRRINHRLKKIYLIPNVYLYLQSFQHEDLIRLNEHIRSHFDILFTISKRKDGHGRILRFTSTVNTYHFLDMISSVTSQCPIMNYKTNWLYRFEQEKQKYQLSYPEYEVIATSSERTKPYSAAEIEKLITYKLQGMTDKQIAIALQRTYWSIVNKLRELRNNGIYQ
ncbi:DNA endonuclease [Gracilibacillus sp. S3-1-1]|uniref:DNA endonuclease n=1 Tax=Gracilibacillus pellucidus TaxID=3095368 RepID=A0ACC6M133_9BACI|nr:DNA endonuclease [Gracilibacillus sp. S3-1-1]MDX8044603.1 DNA endonuclease [Gracilibacillus sp. S3-1-1]